MLCMTISLRRTRNNRLVSDGVDRMVIQQLVFDDALKALPISVIYRTIIYSLTVSWASINSASPCQLFAFLLIEQNLLVMVALCNRETIYIFIL